MSWFRLQCHETQVLSGYLNKQLFQLAEHSGKWVKVTDTLMNLETAGVKTKKKTKTQHWYVVKHAWNLRNNCILFSFYLAFSLEWLHSIVILTFT